MKTFWRSPIDNPTGSRDLWKQAAEGFLCGMAWMIALFAGACVFYVWRIGKEPLVLWYGLEACVLSLAICVGLYYRSEPARPHFSRALLAGACVATVALLIAVYLLDNLIGSSI